MAAMLRAIAAPLLGLPSTPSSSSQLPVRSYEQDCMLMQKESSLEVVGEAITEGAQNITSDMTRADAAAAETPPSPISRLPPSVLSAIFAYLPSRWYAPQRTKFPFYSPSANLRNLRRLDPVLATCRYWRYIALTTPSLWSTVLWMGGSTPDVVARRSHRLSLCATGALYVYVGSGSRGKELEAFLFAYSHRIKELYWDCSSLAQDGVVLELPFPALERCTLLNHCLKHRERTLPVLPASSLLRTLQLHAPSYIPSTSFPALTHLAISSASSRSTLGDLLAFLQKNPQMESLAIDDYSLQSSSAVSLDGWSNYRGRVCLPQLRTLSVKETHAVRLHMRATGQARISDFQRMLVSNLSVPHSCKVELGVLEIGDLHHIASSLFGSAVQATHMLFEGSRPSRLGDAAGWTISVADTQHRLNASFSLAHVLAETCDDPHRAEAAQASLRAAFASLPVFAAVRNLCVRADMLWGLRAPHSFLPAFERLEFLMVYERLATTAFERPKSADLAVEAILKPLEVGPDGLVACPKLMTLVVDYLQPPRRRADDARDRPDRVDAHARVESASILAYVQGVVGARGQAGHPLARALVTLREMGEGSTPEVVGSFEFDASGTVVATSPGREAAERAERQWARGTR